MDFFELLRYRKSTRKFTSEPISDEDVLKILTAANSAPVGSNFYQDLHLTAVLDRDILDKLSEAARKRLDDKETIRKIYGDSPKVNLNPKVFDPFHGAPLVIFVSHRKQDLQPGIEYSNVACIAYSMHLAATGLGLGSCLMWAPLEAMREIPELDNTTLLNLPEGFEPLLGIAIGHPVGVLSERQPATNKISINHLHP